MAHTSLGITSQRPHQQWSVKSASSQRLLEDAISTFCLDPTHTIIKVVSQRRGHGDGLFQDYEQQAKAMSRELSNDSSDQMVASLYDFIHAVRFSVADGAELRAQVIFRELKSLRDGALGKETRWESFVAFVGLRVGQELQRRLLQPSTFGAALQQATLSTSSFFSVPPDVDSVWVPGTVRCATSVVLESMCRVVRASPQLPQAQLGVVLGLLREEGGGVNESAAATLLRILSSCRSNPQDCEWSSVAAHLAARVFSLFLVPNEWRLHADVAAWRQDSWDAAVTIVPRVGSATSCSTWHRGAVMVLRQRWIFWAAAAAESDDSDCDIAERSTSLPTELFNGPLNVDSDNGRRGLGLQVDRVVLLKDLALSSYSASRAVLTSVASMTTTTTLKSTTLLLVEDDVDSATQRFLEGWSAALQDILLTDHPTTSKGVRLRVLVCTNVGKAYMFRVASQLRIAPVPSMLMRQYDVPTLVQRKLGVALSPPHQEWAVSFLLAGVATSDATTYSSWHGSYQTQVREVLFAVDLSPPTPTDIASSTFASVVVCGPTPAVIEAITVNFHRHMARLRSLFSSATDAESSLLVCCPGHGLALAVVAADCVRMSNHSEVPLSNILEGVARWKRQFLDGAVMDAGSSFDDDVGLVLPIVASAFHEAIVSYLSLVLQQSFGFTSDRALARINLVVSTLVSGNDPRGTTRGAASSFKDLYTMFMECPPLLVGGEDGRDEGNFLGRAAELAESLPTVTLSECSDWHSLHEVQHALAAVGRIVETYTSVGIVTASV